MPRPPRKCPRPRNCVHALVHEHAVAACLLGAMLGCVSLTPRAAAQVSAPAEGGPAVPAASLDAPFADPLLNLDAQLGALRVTSWEDGEARMLLLEGDASVKVGDYGFTGRSAVVRIEREGVDAGRVWHIAAYFDQARPMAGLGSVAAEGDGLLITSAIRGAVRLSNPGELRPVERAPDVPLIGEALERLAAHRQAVAGPGLSVPERAGTSEQALVRRERRRAEIAEQQRRLYEAAPGRAVVAAADEREPAASEVGGRGPGRSILPARGAVAYSMESWSAQVGEEETAVSLVGDVRVVFEDYRDGRVVTLRAQRVVLFIGNDGGSEARGAAYSLGQLDASGIHGIYLEDNAIISDGQYTVRAPRVYYDMARNRATLLDAVFYTFDAERQIPLYVRAEAVRQTSASDFRAEGARLTTSEFAVPHFSIGAGELTVSQYRADDGRTGAFFTATGTTLNLGRTPLFYWPYLAASAMETPLRGISAAHHSDNGVQVRTTWDMYALLGKPRPEGAEWVGRLDYLGDHGPAIGTRGEYNTRASLGEFEGYFLADDSGRDEFGGRIIDHADEQRGLALARHRAYLPNNFELSLEAAYVSDPTFLEEFYPDDAAVAKPYETAAYLKRQEGNTAFDVLATTRLSTFTEQLDVLQSDGYTVDRYPELSYRVVGGDLLDGRLSWFGQTSFSQLRLNAGDDAPEDRGFNAAQSAQFFGIAPDTSFNDRLDGLGLPSESVRRLDSRQEITMPMAAGAIDVTPYAVGRVTAYDTDFAEFNGGNDDQARLWGEVGLRVGTEFSRTDPGARSGILDLDGLRHIVEPTATFFVNGSTLDAADLPVYDRDVESLAEGSGVRLGVTNTWQTRRGGPGRQRSVDWITWRNDVVLRADDAEAAVEIPRHYDYRPEYSTGGDHYYTELLWMVTDTLGVAGQLTHSFEADSVAQWRVGAALDHTPRLSSFLAYEEIDVLSSRLLTYGFQYQLTMKYRVGFSQTLDFSQNNSRSIDLIVDRKLPRWTMRISVGYDEIDDESRVGVSFIPDGRIAGGPFMF